MKKVLLLVSILCLSSSALCLSSSAFGQQNQQQQRKNYVSDEMNAGPENLVQIVINVRLYAFLLDDDNFQKYRNGVDYRQLRYGVSTQTLTNPTYVVPPTKQHWHLVIDNGGQPFNVNPAVKLYSLVKNLSPKPPE